MELKQYSAYHNIVGGEAMSVGTAIYDGVLVRTEGRAALAHHGRCSGERFSRQVGNVDKG